SDLALSYDQRQVSVDLDVDIPDGALTVIIGPNACGKSTLLRALARLLKPQARQVYLHGVDIRSLAPEEMARRLRLWPQSSKAPFGIAVGDLGSSGRFPHQHVLRQWSAEDEAALARALTATGITDLAHRSVDELSGGQRQRVWIAMVLAQNTPVMLLDEPTTFLDIAHQLEVLHLCQRLNREEGKTMVLVLHDLNQAARFADHLIVMKDGAIAAAGEPAGGLNEHLVEAGFGLRAQVRPDPVFTTPMVIPIGSLVRS